MDRRAASGAGEIERRRTRMLRADADLIREYPLDRRPSAFYFDVT